MPSIYDYHHIELDKIGKGKRVLQPPGGESCDIFDCSKNGSKASSVVEGDVIENNNNNSNNVKNVKDDKSVVNGTKSDTNNNISHEIEKLNLNGSSNASNNTNNIDDKEKNNNNNVCNGTEKKKGGDSDDDEAHGEVNGATNGVNKIHHNGTHINGTNSEVKVSIPEEKNGVHENGKVEPKKLEEITVNDIQSKNKIFDEKSVCSTPPSSPVTSLTSSRPSSVCSSRRGSEVKIEEYKNTQKRLFGPPEEKQRIVRNHLKSSIFTFDEPTSSPTSSPTKKKNFASRNPITGEIISTKEKSSEMNGKISPTPSNSSTTSSVGSGSQFVRVRYPPGGKCSGIF